MSEEKQGSEMDLEPDLRHERTEWRVQRVGWTLMALLCGAALTGLLGHGPASKKQAGKIGSDLYVEYDRYIRYQAPSTIKVFCRPGAGDQFTLSLDRALIEQTEINEIQPEPKETTTAGDKYVFHFNAAQGSEQLVIFHFEADAFGEISTAVSLNEKSSHHIKQFVWP